MTELLAPVSSPEGVAAAVESGADAIYVSFGDAGALTVNEFRRAAEFCRVRGVKVYVTMDALPSDESFLPAVQHARLACRYGANAVIVSDPGLIRVLRRAVPEMDIHAGPRMNLHSLDGVRMAQAMAL